MQGFFYFFGLMINFTMVFTKPSFLSPLPQGFLEILLETSLESQNGSNTFTLVILDDFQCKVKLLFGENTKSTFGAINFYHPKLSPTHGNGVLNSFRISKSNETSLWTLYMTRLRPFWLILPMLAILQNITLLVPFTSFRGYDSLVTLFNTFIGLLYPPLTQDQS